MAMEPARRPAPVAWGLTSGRDLALQIIADYVPDDKPNPFGCGYLGLRVANRGRAPVAKSMRSPAPQEKGTKLAAEGLRPIVADVTPGTLCRPAQH